VKVGIIGCGVIAPTHAESYQSLDNVQVRWACDLQQDRANELASKFGIPNVTTRAEDVFADQDCQAVSICTDHASHQQLCAQALAAGKHVLCEKALAARPEQLDQMMQAHATRPDLVFSGVFQHRFNTIYQVLKKHIEGGQFGQILTAGVRMHCFRSDDYYRADQWRGTWAYEGGSVLINQAIHMIDILAWMLGGVQSVSAAYANRTHTESIETEDTAVALLKFRNDALGTIKATCSSHYHWKPIVSIHGTAGSVEIVNGKVEALDFKDKPKALAMREELDAAGKPVQAPTGKTYYGGHHQLQIADFVEAVRQKRQPFVPAEQARHAVDIVLGIYESHRTGGWARLPGGVTSV
jgi:predicted dehydrogenase